MLLHVVCFELKSALANKTFEQSFSFVRVLPYDDFSHIRDEEITFDLVYDKVLRYYELILPAMSGIFQVSYDPSGKQATFVSYDSMGAAMMGAGPLSGDSVTFVEQGYMLGIKVKVHETMTKKSTKDRALDGSEKHPIVSVSDCAAPRRAPAPGGSRRPASRRCW